MATDTPNALAEGLFWMAEKLRYGYEDVEVNPAQALRLYQQVADLGFGRAHLRIGEMHERGIGVPKDAAEGFAAYRRAAEEGEITAYAAMARLLGRTTQAPKADLIWQKFFEELAAASDSDVGMDEPAASIHTYLFSKLAHFQDPNFFPVMNRYRTELVGYMQRYLEHISDHEQLDIMRAMV